MCTYNISLDDHLVSQLRPCMNDGVDVQEWLQKQVQMLVVNTLMTHPAQSHVHKTHTHALSDFRGILQSNLSANQMRDEYIEEKYGV